MKSLKAVSVIVALAVSSLAQAERIGEAKLKSLREAYRHAESMAYNVTGTNDEVMSSCIDEVFTEWEDAYFNVLYETQLNLNEMQAPLSEYGEFLALRLKDRAVREAGLAGLSDEVRAEIRSRRQLGSWPRTVDAAKMAIGDLAPKLLNENFAKCMSQELVDQVRPRLGDPNLLAQQEASQKVYFEVSFKRSPPGGIEVKTAEKRR